MACGSCDVELARAGELMNGARRRWRTCGELLDEFHQVERRFPDGSPAKGNQVMRLPVDSRPQMLGKISSPVPPRLSEYPHCEIRGG